MNLLWILLIIYVKQLQRLHIFLFIRLSSIYHSEKFYVQKLAEENIPNLCIITSLFFIMCLFCWRKSDLLRLNYHFAKLFRTFPQVEKSRSLLFIQIECSSRHKMTITFFLSSMVHVPQWYEWYIDLDMREDCFRLHKIKTTLFKWKSICENWKYAI